MQSGHQGVPLGGVDTVVDVHQQSGSPPTAAYHSFVCWCQTPALHFPFWMTLYTACHPQSTPGGLGSTVKVQQGNERHHYTTQGSVFEISDEVCQMPSQNSKIVTMQDSGALIGFTI